MNNDGTSSISAPDLGVVEAQGELREYLHRREDRHKVFPKAALVGVLAGLIAVVFQYTLGFANHARNQIVHWAHGLPGPGWLAPVIFSAIGSMLAIILIRKWAPEAAGSGIPHVEAVLRRHRIFRWKPVLITKFIGGVLAIGSGLALGREGPTVQMGGAVGAGIARLLKVGTQERLTLVAAGAGAGLAAAFNAPLAGLIFVVEELQRDFQPTVFGAAFIAAASADVVSRYFGGQMSVFAAPAYPAPGLALLPFFAVLGVVTGLLGVAFNVGLVASLNSFGKIPARHKLVTALAVGAIVGLIAYFAPSLVGSGHSLAEVALRAGLTLAALPLIFVVRFFLTIGSYGSGAPGGIFSPLLALGAIIGLAVGYLAAMMFPHGGIVPGEFAVVGMAAYFAAIVRAPLTGIVLIVEMTSSYALSLPLLLACFCAYGAAEATRNLPIYEELLERDLVSRDDSTTNGPETIVVELEVEPNSHFDGRKVRELGLPSGVLIVSCREGDNEFVPDANTLLTAYMRITAVVSRLAVSGLEVLRNGCRETPQ